MIKRRATPIQIKLSHQGVQIPLQEACIRTLEVLNTQYFEVFLLAITLRN